MRKTLLLVLVIVTISWLQPKQLKWVAIGDSITYLNDHLNETGNRVTKGYMTRVVEQLPHIQFENKGYNGWTSGRVADSIEKLGLKKADIYSVFLGTNDWWGGRPLGTMADYKGNSGNNSVYGSFRIIIEKLKSLNPGAKIILMTPMQRVDFVYLFNHKNNAFGSYKSKKEQHLESFAKAIDSIGRFEGFPVVDLYHKKQLQLKHLVKFKRLKDPVTGLYKNYSYPHFINIPFDPEKDEYPYPVESISMTYDGLHPSDKGYALISERLIRLMKKF